MSHNSPATTRPDALGTTAAVGASPVKVLLVDGRSVTIRQVRRSDETGLQRLHDQADIENIYRRFFSVSRCAAHDFVTCVCQQTPDDIALVAVLNGELCGLTTAQRIGEHEAELSLFVADELHGCGVGTLLLEHLVAEARRAGIGVVEAQVLVTNTPMLHVFRDAGFDVELHQQSGIIRVQIATSSTDRSTGAAHQRELVAEAAFARHQQKET